MRIAALLLAASLGAAAAGLVFEGPRGPGRGKHIVLVSGDDEYRSEEMLPELARILALRHGFRCTVLFAIDPRTGVIQPDLKNNIPGLEALRTADLMVLFTRFRELPDEQMRFLADYVAAGKPIVALRTATHAFANQTGPWVKWAWNNKDTGGFGREVLGETWIRHHGRHGVESTRGVPAPGAAQHPVLQGIRDGDIWAPTDVYAVRLPLPADATPLVLGQVLRGMAPADEPVAGDKNNPMMPVAWTRTARGRVFVTTLGSAQDLENAGVRRLLVNACYWAAGLERKIRPQSDVALVTDYRPSAFRFGGYRPNVRPEDLRIPAQLVRSPDRR